jgi:acyl-CoA synthetase (AMP-forming)/AMP-acid ligase II
MSRGFAQGDAVAIFLPNCAAYLPFLYGVWAMGGVAVPINAKLHPREVAWIVENSGAKLVVAKEPGRLLEAGVATPVIADAFELPDAPPLAAPVAMTADDPAWLFYTSGTTGRPKGAVLSAGNLMAMSLSYLADVDEVSAEDAALYAAPLSHGAGLYNIIHVQRGARHVVPASGSFDPAEIFELAAHHRNISMFAAPTMVKRMTAAAKARGSGGEGLKTIVYGGGPMYVADIKEALGVFGPVFVQIYGQGETPMTISALSRADIANADHPQWDARLGSVGRAHSVAEVAVVDEDGTPLAPGEVGEIVVRGAAVMKGYLNNPEANAKALKRGWLWTGDMGRLSEDGYLTLHDRVKDLVVSGGSNIYPREVEEALLEHPLVAEVAVVGQPDPEWGEIVVAFVVREGEVTEAEMDAACAERIARFKKPKLYVFVDELPKNNYGKVLKTQLRARLETT